MACLGLLTACDPECDDKSLSQPTLTADQLKQYCSVTVDAENGKNINHVTTICKAPVSVIWTNGIQVVKSSDAEFKMLVTGQQNLTCTALNADGTTTSVDFPVNIEEISPNYPVEPQWAYLFGSGEKTWTWDTEWRSDGGAWGNMGYQAGSGESFVKDGNGVWWGCDPDQLDGQMKHSDVGLVGEESRDAYMIFTLVGTKIQKYKPDGTAIGDGGLISFDMTPTYNGSDVWSIGTLNVTARALLFPFQINSYKDDNGNIITGDKTLTPDKFQIMQLDDEHLKLVYTEASTGGWGEATWWAFKAKK